MTWKKLALLALAAVAGCTHNDAQHATAPAPSLRSPTYQPPPPAPVHPPSPNARAAAPRHAPPAASAVPRHWLPAGPRRAWQYIVIHHSDTAVGSAASFRQYHVQHNHWKDLGYHFVIGNGNGAANGLVEVGGRWTRQETGAHAGVLKYNEQGIGICLVGNFDAARPTASQMQSLARLAGHLMRTYRIPPERVIGHDQAKSGRTDCPGRYLSVAHVRLLASRHANALDPTFPVFERLAQGELLRDASPR